MTLSGNKPCSPSPLLGPSDPAPFSVINRDGNRPLVLLCDHASNQIPAGLGRLGVEEQFLKAHIAWDIGAKGIATRLSEALDAPAVLCGYSRLVIDCNRQPGDPSSIPRHSDGVVVPGNQDLSEADEVARADAIFWPYHHAVTDTVAHLWRKGTPPAVFSVHSYTNKLMSRHQERPWEVAILWKRDPRLACQMIEFLSRQGLRVGDNVPYSGSEDAYSIDMHGAAPGLPYCAVEVRQDLIGDAAGEAEWAGILEAALKDALAERSIYQVKHY